MPSGDARTTVGDYVGSGGVAPFRLQRARSLKNCFSSRASLAQPLRFVHAAFSPLMFFEQVSEAFRKQKTPSQVSYELVNAAREAGSGDDITAVIAKLG